MTVEETATITETNTPINKLLDSWSTSYALVILGALCSRALSMIGSRVLNSIELSFSASIILIIFVIAYTIVVLIYTLVVYPSFFTNKPKMESSKAVSFCNGFIGGIIFGFIWCSNIKNHHKGISNKVFATLMAVILVGSMAVGFYQGINESNTSQTVASSQNIQIDRSYLGDWRLTSYYPDGNSSECLSAQELEDLGITNVTVSVQTNATAIWSLTVDGEPSTSQYKLVNVPEETKTGGYYLINDDGTPDAIIFAGVKGQAFLYLYISSEDGYAEGEVLVFSKS